LGFDPNRQRPPKETYLTTKETYFTTKETFMYLVAIGSKLLIAEVTNGKGNAYRMQITAGFDPNRQRPPKETYLTTKETYRTTKKTSVYLIAIGSELIEKVTHEKGNARIGKNADQCWIQPPIQFLDRYTPCAARYCIVPC